MRRLSRAISGAILATIAYQAHDVLKSAKITGRRGYQGGMTTALVVLACHRKTTTSWNSGVKIVVYLLAGGLALLGLLFVIAAGQANAVARIIIGIVCMGAAAALVALVQLKPTYQTHVHHTKLDLSGDVSLQEISCKQCGAKLSEKSITVTAGAVFVKCEFCSAEYQLEEAPKW